MNVKSKNAVVTETKVKSFLLSKSRILPEKRKPIGSATHDFPAVATRQQGALLLSHKKCFGFFSFLIAKSSKAVARK